jgi:ElaB/YqjD/DUF883 family membrane-anchored ribosome-binding protein
MKRRKWDGGRSAHPTTTTRTENQMIHNIKAELKSITEELENTLRDAEKFGTRAAVRTAQHGA